MRAGVEGGLWGAVCQQGKTGPAGSARGAGQRQEKKRRRGRQHVGLAAAPRLSPGPRNLWVPSKCSSDAPTDPVTRPEAAGGRAQLKDGPS